MNLQRLYPIALLLISFLLVNQSARGQATSTLQGRVSDPSGAVIAGAEVQVTNEATGVGHAVKSNESGYYLVPDLLPGSYDVRTELVGFKTLIRKSIEIRSEEALNLDLQLEVGAASQTVEVQGGVPQVETTEARISTVVNAQQIQALPAIGRSLMALTATIPGVEGKNEDPRAGNCCDAFSSLASPALSSTGNDSTAIFYLDGAALHYGDGNGWNLAFTPDVDAVEEMRVSNNPTSADEGILSGPQVHMVTKGGTNAFHGSGNFTFLQSSFDALPYGAVASDVGSSYQRYFGGTIGGPILKNRLFFFGLYEGLRELDALGSGSQVVVETEAFKDWVVNTRPKSVAAYLLAQAPPFKYATNNLIDINGDGIPDIGTVTMDRPASRKGDQYNARIDYVTHSGRDRFYGTYWRSIPQLQELDVRPQLDYIQKTGTQLVSFVNAHTFRASAINELRFTRLWGPDWNFHFAHNRYDLPCIVSDDGLAFPSTYSGLCNYTYELFNVAPYDIGDTFSWNHGGQTWKFGSVFRHVYMTDPTYLSGDTPQYEFTSTIDFANDNPYLETRDIDASTGKQRNPFVEAWNQELAFFAQDSWIVKPGLTVNLGLRWDYYAPPKLNGIAKPRGTYGPVFTSSQLNPEGIVGIRNQPVIHAYQGIWDNLAPRVGVAWDPTHSGKMAIRGGFYMAYDEIGSLGLYRGYYGNPPISSLVNAGPHYGIPIVYGYAPVGTRDFPINPGLVGPAIDPSLGIFVGTRPALTGFPTNFRQPLHYDANVAIQRQLTNDLSVTATYHYHRISNDSYQFNANRYPGDLVDGQLDLLNPYYSTMTMYSNLGRRSYQGFIFEATKRISNGWRVSGSYTHNDAHSNYGEATQAYHPEVDWARDENATQTFKVNGIWDLPLLRSHQDWVGSIFGGWQLASIFNHESGSYFDPASLAAYGQGGDFNADGQQDDRPDLPATKVSRSYGHQQWLQGAMMASVFPIPDTERNGTLPRNYFVGPGYTRLDASLGKKFLIGERTTLQYQIQASNLVNSVNIREVNSSLTAANFAAGDAFYPMRTVQMAIRAFF